MTEPVRGARSPSDDPELEPELPAASLASSATPSPVRSTGAIDSYREIFALSWPVMLSQMLLNAVGIVDIAMVGRLGSDSVAAVGYATQLYQLSQSVLFAVGFACVALMARAIGAGDPGRARRALAASIAVAAGAALVFCAVMLAAPTSLLTGLGAEPQVARQAVPYLVLVLAASVLLAVSMVFEFGMRADRNARTPMLIAGVVTTVKIAGNAVLIFGGLGFPRLELVGAGLATLVSQVVGLLLFVQVALRSREGSPLRLRPRDFSGCRPLVPEVVRLAVPSVGERLANNLALLAYFRVLAEFGTLAIAAYTVGVRLLSFSWIPGVAFGTAAATLVGQGLGAGTPEAARRAGWRSARLALGVALVLGALCFLVPGPLARLFTDDEALVAELVPFLLFLAAAQPALQAHFALGGAHRGAGDTVTPFVAAMLGNWALRVPIACLAVFVFHADVVWVWAVILADHVLRASWLVWSFRQGSFLGDAAGAPTGA